MAWRPVLWAEPGPEYYLCAPERVARRMALGRSTRGGARAGAPVSAGLWAGDTGRLRALVGGRVGHYGGQAAVWLDVRRAGRGRRRGVAGVCPARDNRANAGCGGAGH